MKTTIKANSRFIPPFEDKTVDVAPGITIEIAWQSDYNPDLSYLETGEAEHYESLLTCKTKAGKPYSPRYARRLARKYAQQDKRRLALYGSLGAGGWDMMGYVATLFINGEEIASDSLWGIESDTDENTIANDFEKKTIDELLARAVPDIKAQIKLLTDALAIAESSL